MALRAIKWAAELRSAGERQLLQSGAGASKTAASPGATMSRDLSEGLGLAMAALRPNADLIDGPIDWLPEE